MILTSKEIAIRKVVSISLIYLILLGSSQIAHADTAIFAGGCFWCMEAYFQEVKGVSDVVSGFTGGTLKNPTYRGNHRGHYEAVEITYDPEVISYQQLLDRYWVNIDPFDSYGQFCDKGPSYLAAIFVGNEAERILAEKSKQAVVDEFKNKKVVTEILPSSTFYPIKGIESDHQDYYINHSTRYKFYRISCRRDARLRDIWGDRVTH